MPHETRSVPPSVQPRIHVLVISAEFPPAVGGVGAFAHNLARALLRKGSKVKVVTSTPARQSDSDEVEVVRGTMLWNRKYVKMIYLLSAALRICARERPGGLVAMTWGHDGIVAFLLARLFGMPYVVAAHGSELIGSRNRARQWLMQRILSRAGVTIANSNFTRQLVRSLVPTASRVEVVHPPVEIPVGDMERLRAQADERLGLAGRRVILTAARLVRRKGHAIVFEALAELRRAFPSVLYVVTGDGPYRSTLEQLRLRYRLAEHVRMLGVVSSKDLHMLFARADICISSVDEDPRDVEGFGIAVAEACAYGKPVIAGRTGGVVDFMFDGETGLLIEPGNAVQLKGALLRLLADRALGEKLGAAARATIMREASMDTQGERLIQLLATSGMPYGRL